MNNNDEQLWNRIKEFQFDEPGIAFCFSNRLANENNWKKDFAIRAIEEYRKFIYLCCVAGHQVTPSDEVDQVWHLHLTFTKSYWNELCGRVVGRELHHNPTKGGKEEKKKFDECYANTLNSYRKYFGTTPPRDLWPEGEIRFRNSNCVRVDTLQNWIIRKPKRGIRIAAVIFLLSVTGMLNLNAYDNNDVIAGLGALVIFAVIVIQIWRSGRGGGDGGSSGCSVTGCGGSHTGCSSHGCSSSGCSGCGGGGCGGD